MQIQFFNYELLTKNKLNKLLQGQNCTLIYDRKPEISSRSVKLCPLNVFRLATWRGTFTSIYPGPVVFQLRMFSEELLFCFFKNIFVSPVFVFTEDFQVQEALRAPMGPQVSVRLIAGINIYAVYWRSILETVKKSLPPSKDIARLCIQFCDFVQLVDGRLNALREAVASGRVVAVLSEDEAIFKLVSGIFPARTLLDRTDAVCFILDFDENFDFNGFSEYVIFYQFRDNRDLIMNDLSINNSFIGDNTFISETDIADINSTIDGSVKCDDANNSIANSTVDKLAINDLTANSTVDKLPINDLTANSFTTIKELLMAFSVITKSLDPLITLPAFSRFLSFSNLSPFISHSLEAHPLPSFLNLQIISIGSLSLPFDCLRLLLDMVLDSVKKTLETRILFIRSVLPKITYHSGGLMNREIQAVISLPGLFNWEIPGEYYQTKKEAVCDASRQFILELLGRGLLTENLEGSLDGLLRLESVKELFIRAYGENDQSDIFKVINGYIEDHKENRNIINKGNAINKGDIINKDDATNKRDIINKGDHKKNIIKENIKRESNIILKRNGSIGLVYNHSSSFFRNEFKHAHMIDLIDTKMHWKNENFTLDYFEESYRKPPTCLLSPSDSLSLYIFGNSQTGILCGESFRGSHTIPGEGSDVLVVYGGTRRYNEEEIKRLTFYQVIFFRMLKNILPTNEQTIKLFYYVVPLLDTGRSSDQILSVDRSVDPLAKIDWIYLEKIYSEFLYDHVYNWNKRPFSYDPLVWNPFSREFHLYIEEIPANLEDEISCNIFTSSDDAVEGNTASSKMTFLDFFEEKHRITLTIRKGRGMFRSCLAEQCSSILKNQFSSSSNINNTVTANTSVNTSNISNGVDNSLTNTINNITSDAVNYSLNDQITNKADSQINNRQIPHFPIINTENMPDTTFIVSTECSFFTPIRSSILQEVEIFKRNFFVLEDLLIAEEIRQVYAPAVPLSEIVCCFTGSGVHPTKNYERLEFLGDSLLKFLTTSRVFLLRISMCTSVPLKDTFLSNQHLWERCVEVGLARLLRVGLYAPQMAQAPQVGCSADFLSYFNAERIFLSDNYARGITREKGLSSQTIKRYADMVEALMGVAYLYEGIKGVVRFVKVMGIFETVTGDISTDQQSDNNNGDNVDNNTGSGDIINNANNITSNIFNNCKFYFKIPTYLGLFPSHDITAVELIIGYNFTHPSILERALVHPSFTAQIPSEEFQRLEFLGDAALDAFVTTRLFHSPELVTPLLLHSARKSYVNNVSLNRLFHSSGLERHAKYGEEIKDASKACSDMVEALIGAVVVDVAWNVEKFMEVMERKMRGYLEECRGELDFN